MSKQAVLDLVGRWARAELDGDVAAFDELLAPEFVGIGPVGFVLDREQWVHRHRAGVKNDEFAVEEPHVRAFGDTVLVEGVQRQVTTAMGRDTSGSFRVVVAATRRDDRWVIVNIQLSGPLIAPGELPPFAR